MLFRFRQVELQFFFVLLFVGIFTQLENSIGLQPKTLLFDTYSAFAYLLGKYRVKMSGKDKFSKVILLGEEAVGKTSILLRFTENQFHQTAPDGIEWKEKRMQVDDENVALRIFDTASQESFR